ncbi:Adaptor protein complex, sigma subunit [Trema orientale]|uniref:Adaptor AP-1 19 kDa protein n=1 Tax=Trema orientale TaxID=63057 RepID=A0A2P5AZB0_TREOI|nr:Adaptor protein complex, sigma subunit [Trema orientale]
MNNISFRSHPTSRNWHQRKETITEEEKEEEASRSTIQKIAGKSPSASRSLKSSKKMIHFVLLISRQGKVRLTKWYSPYSQKERTKVIRELSGVILTRGPKLCNFVEWRGYKVVYKRYASLYFCMCIDQEDNELEVLEIIHHYVEILDRYFGSVCELDLIFNFHKAYYILDELLIAGELQESSKKTVARLIAAQDSLVETAKEEASSISNIIAQATK